MHLDGFFFNCLVKEINGRLSGSRVEDVYASQGDNLIIQVRAPGHTLRLEISVASPPFAFFLAQDSQRGRSPTILAQTIKKHINGLFCLSVTNELFDRRAILALGPLSDGGPTNYIHIEIMGRQNDIILCQGDTILASTRPPRKNAVRSLQPGDLYMPPPPAGKLPPHTITATLLATLFSNIGVISVRKALVRGILGVSPILAKEICWRAQIPMESTVQQLLPPSLDLLTGEIQALALASLEKMTSPLIYDQEGPYWTALEHLQGEFKELASLSLALEHWTDAYRSGDGSGALRTRLQATISVALVRLEGTMAKQRMELKRAQDFEHLRQIGDTILASIPAISRGSTEVILDNVHTGHSLKIPLDPNKSASSNAAYYYKRYTKYKNARVKVQAQIAKNIEQREYLNSLEYALESADTLLNLQEIQQEMEDQGLLRSRKRSKPPSQPHETFLSFRSPQGDPVLVGKNNRQNEHLTLRKADKNHYWLHCRHFPGSHVILCTDSPDDASLEFAAALAAWYSKARFSPKVEIVWTQVKNVKKIPGTKPGMVQYVDYRSAFVKPHRHGGGEGSP